MKNIKIKSILFLILGISAVIWFLIAYYKNIDMSNFQEYIKILPQVVTIDLVLYSIFTKWLWKLKIFQYWLVPFPDLQGTWEGFIFSNWENPDGTGKIKRIPAILTIKQSFSSISCKVKTSESTSFSYAEGFKIDEERQVRQLVYSYTNKPKLSLSERSAVHEGTIILDIILEREKKLKGEYWTSRKTTGEVVFKFREKKLLEDIPDELDEHPMDSETR